MHAGAYPPKLRPDIVTDKTPDIAVFAFSAFDRDGASKLNALNLHVSTMCVCMCVACNCVYVCVCVCVCHLPCDNCDTKFTRELN